MNAEKGQHPLSEDTISKRPKTIMHLKGKTYGYFNNPGWKEIHPDTGEIIGHCDRFSLNESIATYTEGKIREYSRGVSPAAKTNRLWIAQRD